MDDPDFSSKIGLRQFGATIVLQLHAKFREDPMTGCREKLPTNERKVGGSKNPKTKASKYKNTIKTS